MHLTILTPAKRVFEGDIQKITFPGSAGPFQVLQDHAPIVSMLQKGTIIYEDEYQEHILTIEEGWVNVFRNRMMVLVISAT